MAKIELLLTGKLRDSSAPQLILASLANSILFASWEDTAVHAVTVNLDVITNFDSGKIFNTRKYMLMIRFVKVSNKVHIQNDHP